MESPGAQIREDSGAELPQAIRGLTFNSRTQSISAREGNLGSEEHISHRLRFYSVALSQAAKPTDLPCKLHIKTHTRLAPHSQSSNHQGPTRKSSGHCVPTTPRRKVQLARPSLHRIRASAREGERGSGSPLDKLSWGHMLCEGAKICPP